MKNDPIVTLLNFVLAVLVVLSVVFACFFMWRTVTLRALQSRLQLEAQSVQIVSGRLQVIMNDVIAYNNTAKNPELQQIIQSAQAPAQPAAK